MKDATMSRKHRTAFTKRLASRTWLLGCALAVASGCAQVSPLRSLGLHRTSPKSLARAEQPIVAGCVAAATNSPAQPSAHMPFAANAAVDHASQNNRPATRSLSDRDVMPVAFEQPISSNHMVCPADGACLNGLPAAAMGPAGMCAPLPMVEGGPVPPYWNDQEYLIDGGDREPAVIVTEEWEVRGLDSEDTVAHYETIDGKLCVTPSNRVAIYAPRFGAVRKVAAPILAARAVGAERMLEPTGAVVQQSRDLAGDVTMPLGPKKQSNVKLIDGLRDRTRGVPAEKITPLADLSNPQVAFQHVEGLGTVVRREDLEARRAEAIINARTWETDESIAIMIGGVQAVELRDTKHAQDVVLYESEPGKCTLRICKAASHSAASPGDIVSFSIRFDNIGDKPIGNLVILDSLTTRLEYIDGSQQCILSLANQSKSDPQTAAVKFSTSENEAGSTVLKWEADLPLASGDSGVISFRCRIR